MIALALSSVLFLTPQTSGQLVSKMLARYSNADKLSGNITFKQVGGDKSLTISTLIQIDRQHKLYIRQTRNGANIRAIVAADGTMFTYEMPDSIAKKQGDRLYELQNQRGVVYTAADIYSIGLPGLLDRSPVLDILVAKTEHLRFIRGQLATLNWKDGKSPREGEDGVVTGDWRAYQSAPVSGSFSMTISPSGDLQSWSQRENVAVPGASPILVTSIWTVNVKVGDSGDAALYRVVRK